jgi:hypothetical protein
MGFAKSSTHPTVYGTKKPGAVSRPGAIPQFLFPDSMIRANSQ